MIMMIIIIIISRVIAAEQVMLPLMIYPVCLFIFSIILLTFATVIKRMFKKFL